MKKHLMFASVDFTPPHQSLLSGGKRFLALISGALTVILLGMLLTSCEPLITNGAGTQQPNSNSSGNCHAEPNSDGTLLAGVNSITVPDGQWADIEWYRGTEPEKDSVVGPGTYNTSGLSGKYWLFVGCSSEQQVIDQVTTHIQQRLNDHANNVGSIVPFNP